MSEYMIKLDSKTKMMEFSVDGNKVNPNELSCGVFADYENKDNTHCFVSYSSVLDDSNTLSHNCHYLIGGSAEADVFESRTLGTVFKDLYRSFKNQLGLFTLAKALKNSKK